MTGLTALGVPEGLPSLVASYAPAKPSRPVEQTEETLRAQLLDVLDSTIRTLAKRQVEALDHTLSVAPPGWSVCVHGVEFLAADSHSMMDDWHRFTIRQRFHFLEPDGVCTGGSGGRTVYGPMP